MIFFVLLYPNLAYHLVVKSMKKILCFGFLFGILILALSVNVKATELGENAKSSILIESSTQTVLQSKNEDFRLAPASMTKIMTLTIIFEYIDSGKLKMDDMIVGTAEAKAVEGSKAFLDVNEKLSLDDMIKCIAIASANDCAIAVAQRIAGSESVFVDLMNHKVEELGLKNTHFEDCTGLAVKNHYSSAYDMAIMANELITKYPKVLEYTNIREDYIRKETDNPFWLVNTNKLIGKQENVDGLKTGWTQQAGYCLTATKKQDDMRLISVVMGYSDPNVRNTETMSLLNYGFSNYKLCVALEKGTIVKEFKNIGIHLDKICAQTKENLYIVLPINEELKEITFTLELQESKKYFIENEVVGKASVYYDGKLYKEIEVTTSDNIKKLSFFEVVMNVIRIIF